jgi:hypothetical protein
MGSTVASYFGGGAAFGGGVWTPPTFVVQGSSHGNVGDAFAAVDGVLSTLDTRVTDLEALPPGGGTQGPQGPAGPAGPQGPAGSGLAGLDEDQVRGIATEIAGAGDADTLNEATAYTDGREDAIRDDMATGDTSTLNSANEYTDIAIQQLIGFDADGLNDRLGALEDRFDDVDRRLHQQNRRIDRMGAMGAAMLNMAINAAGTQSERGRIAVGAGFQGGEKGLSIGYGKRVGRASFSLGGAFGGSDRSAGVGFGIDL